MVDKFSKFLLLFSDFKVVSFYVDLPHGITQRHDVCVPQVGDGTFLKRGGIPVTDMSVEDEKNPEMAEIS